MKRRFSRLRRAVVRRARWWHGPANWLLVLLLLLLILTAGAVQA